MVNIRTLRNGFYKTCMYLTLNDLKMQLNINLFSVSTQYLQNLFATFFTRHEYFLKALQKRIQINGWQLAYSVRIQSNSYKAEIRKLK